MNYNNELYFFSISVGHGRSEGQRAQVHDFEQYVDDVLLHVDMILGQYPDLPAFVLGHSMVRRRFDQ